MKDTDGLSYDGNGDPMGVGVPLTDQEMQAKADAFDASFANPRQYALDNFGAAGPTKAQRYAAVHQNQVGQERSTRGRHRR